ncbi:MAG: ABC transporter ATP-binding protein, partial [Acidobacteria bacterium]
MRVDDGQVIISLQHIDKSLGGKPVLRDMSVDVKQGESLVIVGGSGQGKSVTLKHMIGLMQPDDGHVYVLGEDLCCLEAKELNRFRR